MADQVFSRAVEEGAQAVVVAELEGVLGVVVAGEFPAVVEVAARVQEGAGALGVELFGWLAVPAGHLAADEDRAGGGDGEFGDFELDFVGEGGEGEGLGVGRAGGKGLLLGELCHSWCRSTGEWRVRSLVVAVGGGD